MQTFDNSIVRKGPCLSRKETPAGLPRGVRTGSRSERPRRLGCRSVSARNAHNALRPLGSASASQRRLGLPPPRACGALRFLRGLGFLLLALALALLALDELEDRHFGGIPEPPAELQDPGVAAGPLDEARRDVREQLREHALVLMGRPAMRRLWTESSRARVIRRSANRAGLAGLRQGGADALVVEQRQGKGIEERLAVSWRAAEPVECRSGGSFVVLPCRPPRSATAAGAAGACPASCCAQIFFTRGVVLHAEVEAAGLQLVADLLEALLSEVAGLGDLFLGLAA